MNTFDESFRRKFQTDEVKAYTQFYEETLKLMKSEDLETFDLSKESEETHAAYGDNTFSQGCLLARRLVERGTRVVQLLHRGWDQHYNLPSDLRLQCGDIDQPCAALISDLKQRGLLDDTLIVWGGEFGRTTYSQGKLEAANHGRDHHGRCFTMWLAGGGVRPGIQFGETDDFCFNISRDPVHVHDLHATLLHVLGFEHTKLNQRFQGLDMRLTGVAGELVTKMLA